MFPRPRTRSAARAPRAPRRPCAPRAARRAAALILPAIALLVAACGASFSPTGPCTGDGSQPGAFPDLEKSVPTTFRGTGPRELDSGRICTPQGLGSLAAHDVDEVHFAGATWETGSQSGVSLAIFTNPSGPALETAWLAEYYESGARAGKKVESVETADYRVSSGVVGRRVDVLNGESFQTVVVWERRGQMAIVVVADFIREIQTREAHDAVVRQAVDAFGT